jgi:predicted RNA binding protein YcfA (HicA-like mRNA interferase family)
MAALFHAWRQWRLAPVAEVWVSGKNPFAKLDLLRQSAVVKIKEILKLIQGDGWYLVRTRGSHRQFRHPTRPGLVTVAGKPSDDLAPGTENSILKQAGLK